MTAQYPRIFLGLAYPPFVAIVLASRCRMQHVRNLLMTIVQSDRTEPHRAIACIVPIIIRRDVRPSATTGHYRTRSIPIPEAHALTTGV
jgi:hypothetical protein